MLKHYYSSTAPSKLLENRSTFAVVTFSKQCTPSQPGVINTGVSSLPEEGLSEVWELPGQLVARGTTGNCYWSKSEDFICAAVWASPEQCQDISLATENAYKALLSLLKDSDYPHPFRFWNYIPRINLGDGDFEEYKKFCDGRLSAFQELDFPSSSFPAASALGHDTEGAVFFVFSAREPGKQFENPLQEKAYCYPRQYGQSSPSFSRATKIKHGTSAALFVSGTASIVGHETIHTDKTEGQVKTTIANIRNLLTHAGQNSSAVKSLKVYLRNKDELAKVRSLVLSSFPEVATLYTRADVCRSNLLVEIEAHCQQ